MRMKVEIEGGSRRPGRVAPPAELPLSLARAREAVNAIVRRRLAGTGLSRQQWRVLDALESRRALGIGELGSTTELGLPSVSRIVKELQRRGMLAVSHSDDGRARFAALTVGGRSLVAAYAPLMAEFDHRISETVGDDKLEQLLSLLADVEHRLGAQSITTQQGGKHA